MASPRASSIVNGNPRSSVPNSAGIMLRLSMAWFFVSSISSNAANDAMKSIWLISAWDVPGFICFGHRTISGTRVPPS